MARIKANHAAQLVELDRLRRSGMSLAQARAAQFLARVALFKALGRALCAGSRIDERRAGQTPWSRACIFHSKIRRNIKLAEAPSHGLPAIAYDRRSSGSEAYWKVAMELVERQ